MQDIAEAPEPGPGIQTVCNIGAGGRPVRLLARSAPGVELVWFVASTGPGVSPVNIVEGLMPRAVRAAIAASGRDTEPEVAAPDMDELSEEDHGILRHLSAVWEHVNESAGRDQSILETAADSTLPYLDRSWPHERWTETCLVIAANSSVALWTEHRDAAAAYQRLQPVADQILALRWFQGGPTGHFAAHEAQNVLLSLSQCKAVLTKRFVSRDPQPTKTQLNRSADQEI